MSTVVTTQALAASPSTDTLHVDVHGIRVELHSVVGFHFAGTILNLSDPVRIGASHVATGELDGLPVRVVAPAGERVAS